MNKVKELRIDSTLSATPAELVNLIDFEPKVLKQKIILTIIKKFII